jgi:hypothetical protein
MYAFVCLFLQCVPIPAPPPIYDPGPGEACRVFHYCVGRGHH